MNQVNGLLKNLLLCLLVIIFMLAFSELVIRLIERPEKTLPRDGWAIIPERSWIEYHPVLGWWHKKNGSAYLEKGPLKILIETNSAGLRGSREYAPTKPADATRVLALGDSFTFGFGVKNEETFSSRLEGLQSDLEVLNFGSAGYGVDQMLLLFDTLGKRYQPDIVLISIFPEDFWRATRAYNDAGHGKPYFTLSQQKELRLHHVPVPEDKNFSVPQFPGIYEKNTLRQFLGKSRLYFLCLKAFSKVLKRLGMEDPDTSDPWILGRVILKELIKKTREINAKPVFVLIPPVRWLSGTDEPVRQSLARFCSREGVDFLDLTTVFSGAINGSDISRFYIPNDEHWSAEGHDLAAKSILTYINKAK